MKVLIITTILLMVTTCFPINPWKSFSPPSFNPSTHSLLKTVIDTTTSDIILYTPALSLSGNSMIIYCCNVTGSTVNQLSTQSFTFTQVISKTNIVIVKNEIFVSFYEGSSAYYARFEKLTLNRINKYSVVNRMGGVYIRPY